jgi:hypothetical protein
LRAGAFVNVPDCGADGGTALHKAVKNGHIGVVELLCSYGCDQSLRDGRGKCALDLAREAGRADIVDMLQREWPNIHTHEPSASEWITKITSTAPDEYGRALCTGQLPPVKCSHEATVPSPSHAPFSAPSAAPSSPRAVTSAPSPLCQRTTGVTCATCNAKVYGVVTVPTLEGNMLVCLTCARGRRGVTT